MELYLNLGPIEYSLWTITTYQQRHNIDVLFCVKTLTNFLSSKFSFSRNSTLSFIRDNSRVTRCENNKLINVLVQIGPNLPFQSSKMAKTTLQFDLSFLLNIKRFIAFLALKWAFKWYFDLIYSAVSRVGCHILKLFISNLSRKKEEELSIFIFKAK